MVLERHEKVDAVTRIDFNRRPGVEAFLFHFSVESRVHTVYGENDAHSSGEWKPGVETASDRR